MHIIALVFDKLVYDIGQLAKLVINNIIIIFLKYIYINNLLTGLKQSTYLQQYLESISNKF